MPRAQGRPQPVPSLGLSVPCAKPQKSRLPKPPNPPQGPSAPPAHVAAQFLWRNLWKNMPSLGVLNPHSPLTRRQGTWASHALWAQSQVRQTLTRYLLQTGPHPPAKRAHPGPPAFPSAGLGLHLGPAPWPCDPSLLPPSHTSCHPQPGSRDRRAASSQGLASHTYAWPRTPTVPLSTRTKQIQFPPACYPTWETNCPGQWSHQPRSKPLAWPCGRSCPEEQGEAEGYTQLSRVFGLCVLEHSQLNCSSRKACKSSSVPAPCEGLAGQAELPWSLPGDPGGNASTPGSRPECVPKRHSHQEPRNVALLGTKVFEDVIKLRIWRP